MTDLVLTPIATNLLNEIAACRAAHLILEEGMEREAAKAEAARDRGVWKAHMISGFIATIDGRPCVFDRQARTKVQRPVQARQEVLL